MPELRVVVSARWQQPVELLLNSPQPCTHAFASAGAPPALAPWPLIQARRPLRPPAFSCHLPAGNPSLRCAQRK